jgi:hypothetical protein
MGYWFTKCRSSQSEEPGWELVKASGCGVEMVEQLEDTIFWNEFRVQEGGRLFECWLCVASVRGNGGVVVIKLFFASDMHH